MIQSVLGIDVSKDTLDVALLRKGTSIHASFTNNEGGFARLTR